MTARLRRTLALLALAGASAGAARAEAGVPAVSSASGASEGQAVARLCAWVADPQGPLAAPSGETPAAPVQPAPAPDWSPPGPEVLACLRRAGAPVDGLAPERAAARLGELVGSRANFERLREAARSAAGSPPGCKIFMECVAGSGAVQPAAGEGIPAALRLEFERICALTESAAGLPPAELAELAAAAERLDAQLAPLVAPESRVIRFRLRKCRELFDYLRALHQRKHLPTPP